MPLPVLPPFPVQTPVLDANGKFFSFGVLKWFQTVQQILDFEDFIFPGQDLGAQINAALAQGLTFLQIPDGNYTVTTPIVINVPCFIQFGFGTVTFDMPDQGTAAGAISITSDDVTIQGRGAGTVFTQPNGQNIQTAIFLGAHQNISFRQFRGDWNDVNVTNSAGFYTFVRSSAGSGDLMVYDCQFTRGGDRAIDFRGANRVWIVDNYFFKTGLSTIHAPSSGNSVSVDVDGTTQSTDVWLVHNLVEQQGDSFAAADGLRVHIMGNTIRSAADFGNPPTEFESGIDASGNVDCEIIGNIVSNVPGPQCTVQGKVIGSTNYVPRNISVQDNEFIANTAIGGPAVIDPRLQISMFGTPGQQENISVCDNTFDGVRISCDTVKGVKFHGNIFNNILSAFSSTAISIDQAVAPATGLMSDFSIQDNLFLSDNGTLKTTVFVTAEVNTPGQVIYQNNLQDSAIPNGFTSSNQISPATIAVDHILAHGKALAASNVNLSAAWGAGATVSFVEGTDTAGRVVVTCGTAPSGFPQLTVNFTEKYVNGPVTVCCRTDTGDQPALGFSVFSSFSTGCILTFLGTPNAGDLYAVSFMNFGL